MINIEELKDREYITVIQKDNKGNKLIQKTTIAMSSSGQYDTFNALYVIDGMKRTRLCTHILERAVNMFNHLI
jgi:hypothetical protein